MHKARALFFVCAGLLGLALLLPHPAAAAWPTDPTVNVPLCTATGNQYTPTITSDGVGGAIITWYDARRDNGDIYAQRVNAAGVPLWTVNGVALCTAASNQWFPTVVSDGAGGAIVTWQDPRNGLDTDIYAQRVDEAGVPQWTIDGVPLCTATSYQTDPTIATDGAGGAIITWYDFRSGNDDIYAQRVNSAGVPQWTTDGVALCTAIEAQQLPRIAADGAGGSIVTWLDNRNLHIELYAQKVNATGTPQWTADGVALCTMMGSLDYTIVADGAGGAIVAWRDARSGTNHDIYVQRVNAAGVPQWTTDGAPLCTATGNQWFPRLAADGSGGATVAWQDYRSGSSYDIYAQRVSAAGAPQWTANGIPICTAANSQESPTIVGDGLGGVIVVWQDYRGGSSYDIYAQKVNAAGTPQWPADGMPLCTAANSQASPTIVSDGSGGAVATWRDSRSSNYDIYAQRIDQWGYLGPEPTIASVRDVPNDQGGEIKVSWYASPLDSFPTYSIADYLVFRSVPPNYAAQALREGALLVSDAAADQYFGSRVLVTRGQRSCITFWEYMGVVPATHKSGYSYVLSTVCDSVAASNPKTLVMVEARTSGGAQWWDSDPDSGYSVDNLAPPAPAPFTGQFASGTATLHWGLSSATDFATFRLYRGNSADFVPGPGNLVASQADTGYVDHAVASYWYKLLAVDIHGNEGPVATLLPSGSVDVPNKGPAAFALEGLQPNPASGQRLSVAFSLATAASANLELLDVNGRLVAQREVGAMGVGRHVLDLAESHHISPGLYLVRLTQGANVRVTRAVVLR
jgi:predicted lipoprotein with Yx(FWY)xxD motif